MLIVYYSPLNRTIDIHSHDTGEMYIWRWFGSMIVDG